MIILKLQIDCWQVNRSYCGQNAEYMRALVSTWYSCYWYSYGDMV